MENRKRFCVVCGFEETPDVKLDGGLCPRCLPNEKSKAVMHPTPTIRLCKYCGSLEERGKWVAPTSCGLEEDLSSLLRRNVKKFAGVKEGEILGISIIRMPMSLGANSVLIPISIKTQMKNKQETPTAREFEMKVRLTPTMCPNCLLMKSKYYEAALQVRTSNAKMSMEDKEKLLGQIGSWVEESSRRDKKAFISKCEDKPEGFDLYLGSRQVAYSIATKLKAMKRTTIRKTFKVGRVDKSTGKRKGKATILIRLPQKLIDELTNGSRNAIDYPKD
jgi:nonsense-mediated mRNA decay protein 3